MPAGNGRLEVDDAGRALAAVLTAIALAFLAGWALVKWGWRVVRWGRRWGDLAATLVVALVVAYWLWPFLGSWALVPVWPAAPLNLVALILLVGGAVWFWLRCPLEPVQAWYDRKSEGRLRRREAIVWYQAARAAGVEGTKAREFAALGLPGNVEFEVVLPVGMTRDEVEKAEPLLKAHYPPHRSLGRPRDVQVHPPAESVIDRVQVRVIRNRAYSEQTPPVLWRPGDPVALREDGEGWSPPFPGYSYLIVGQAGSGKSGWINAFLAYSLECGFPVRRRGVDLKRVELAPWAPIFDDLATDYPAAGRLLDSLPTLVQSRYLEMERRGIRKWSPRCGLPAELVVVDELREVVQQWPGEPDKKAAGQRLLRLVSLTSMGRAAGVVLLGATQNPLADVVGRIRDNVGGTVCGWVRTETEAVTALGEVGRYLHPERIQVPGEAWVVPSGDLARGPFKARARWLPDAEVRRLAGRHAFTTPESRR